MTETINIVRCRQFDEFDDRPTVPPKRHAASGCTGDGWRPKLSLPRDGRGARKTCGRRLRYVGDIIIESEDRYGDAVNIAARLQQIGTKIPWDQTPSQRGRRRTAPVHERPPLTL